MLTREQVIDLLSVATAYDHRNVGEADIAAWSEAARRGHWRFDNAVEAMHDYYATHREWIMPADIAKRVREMRDQPTQYLGLPPAAPADPTTRARIMAMVRDSFSLPKGIRRERRPARVSPEQQAAVDAARHELDSLRAKLKEEGAP